MTPTENAQITLEKIEFSLVQRASKNLIEQGWHNPGLTMWYDETTEFVLMKFNAFLLGEKIPSDIIIRYPANWWEAFKQHWLPFLGIRYTEVNFSITVIYPELLKKFKFPEEPHRILVNKVVR